MSEEISVIFCYKQVFWRDWRKHSRSRTLPATTYIHVTMFPSIMWDISPLSSTFPTLAVSGWESQLSKRHGNQQFASTCQHVCSRRIPTWWPYPIETQVLVRSQYLNVGLLGNNKCWCANDVIGKSLELESENWVLFSVRVVMFSYAKIFLEMVRINRFSLQPMG